MKPTPEQFEDLLRRQPPRSLPAEWRAEILANARAPQAAAVPRRPWLWPAPKAWAALAACWLIVFGSQAAFRHSIAGNPVPTPPPGWGYGLVTARICDFEDGAEAVPAGAPAACPQDKPALPQSRREEDPNTRGVPC